MLIYQFAKLKILKPESDVPVTFGIPDQSFQSTLNIQSCEIEIIHSYLRLFGTKALVRFILKGSLEPIRSNWQPYIEEVNISERLIRNDGYELTGDIVITPIIGQKPVQRKQLIQKNIDINYSKSNQSFNVKVEKEISAFKGGINRYIVNVDNKKYNFELYLDNTSPL